MFHPTDFAFGSVQHPANITVMPQDNDNSENHRAADNCDMCMGNPYIEYGGERGEYAWKRDDFKRGKHQKKRDERYKENKRSAVCKDPKCEQETVQCGYRFSDVKPDKNRIAVSAGSSERSAADDPNVVIDNKSDKNGQRYLQKVKGHDSQTGFAAQNAACVAAAQIAAAMFTYICAVKYLSNHIGERHRTDEIADNGRKKKVHSPPHL